MTKTEKLETETTSPQTNGTATKVEPRFRCWELIEKVVGRCDRLLLWGVSGTGKSWAARRANLNDSQVFSVSLTDDTPAAELRGHYGLVEGSYRWLDGPCVMAWRTGARLVLNELEKASGDAQTFLLERERQIMAAWDEAQEEGAPPAPEPEPVDDAQIGGERRVGRGVLLAPPAPAVTTTPVPEPAVR
jgi:hypothetical protein